MASPTSCDPATAIRPFQSPTKVIPQSLQNVWFDTPIQQWFLTDFTALNAAFLALAGTQTAGSIRITLWSSDGTVLYDNYNGRNATEISTNYFVSSTQNNNHGTRLEGQLAVRDGSGAVIRGSTTVGGDSFLYWAHYVANPAPVTTSTDTVRGVRISLQLPAITASS